jgi:hypothetical protein
MVFTVSKRLRGCYNDTLTGMDTKRIKVLHVADSDTVIISVTYNFIFHFFPSFE